MSITQTASRVRIESSAKNGTLGSQAAAEADEVIFDTAVSTNNGDLEASPTFDERHVIIRRGDPDEEIRLIRSVDVDGVTCQVYEDWDDPPVSGDTYDISYILEDVATIAGCDFETDSRQWAMTKRLVVGVGATTFGFLGLSHGRILRLDDRGPTTTDLQVTSEGYFCIGTEKQRPNGTTVAERGAVLIFDKSDSDETAMDIDGVARMFEFGMYSARSPEGVRGLTVTHDVGADVVWSRFQGAGMDTPYKKKVVRYQDIDSVILISVSDLKDSEAYKGWLNSELDQTIIDLIAAEADAKKVAILVEDA